MNKVLAVFWRDLRRILRNPVALAIVVGICVVPCLYAWVNVLANWDPYQNTSDVPVAVVNEDRSVTLDELGEICVGDLMVDALSDNDKIGWQFMDEDAALEGVRSGSYYAAIVIPPDFTSHLTGVLDGKTDKAQLAYYVNEKANPIAPKVTDTGASTIETTIDSQFSAKVGEVVAQKLGSVTSKLVAESKGVLGEEESLLGEVRATLIDVSDQLGSLGESLQKAQDALGDAVDDLSPLEGLGGRVGGKLDDMLTRVAQTRSNANSLVYDLNSSLGKGTSAITSISTQTSADISAVAGDVAYAQAQINAAIRALENDLTDSQAMVASLTDARDLVVSIPGLSGDTELLRADLQRDLERELGVMVQISDAQQAKLDELRGISQRLESAADEVANLSQQVDGKVQVAAGALQNAQSGTIGTTLLQVHSALDTFTQIGNELESAAQMVDPTISQTVSLARQFASSLSGADEALDGTRSSLSALADTVQTLNDELSAIRASKAWTVLEELTKTNPQGVHDFLTAPVEINEVDLFPVENYASGVAPFFTSLALWVGGIALVAIFKLEVDEEEVGELRPWQAYFGRCLLFVLLGVLQALVCCMGDLAIGIQCAHPWALYLSAVVASFVFVNIIFALSVAFKHLGKALAFTLIILQVPGSAGTYPIEMMPPFFQAIYPWLPFTYSNNAMREAIGGLYENNLAHNLIMLLLFVVPAILLGVTARRNLANINALFDRRLRETDHLMVIEPVAAADNHHRLATVAMALRFPEQYREEFERRSAAFEKAYPGLVRRGLLLLLVLPLGLFFLMLGSDAKLPAVACFVVSIIAIYSFLIVVEYVHDRIRNRRVLADMTGAELEAALDDALREELMPLPASVRGGDE